jgi:DNA polymerase-1
LKYKELDAKYQYKLFVMQNKRVVAEGLEEPYISQVDRAATLVLAQYEGVLIDTKQVEIYRKKFSQDIVEIKADIMNLPEVAEYEKQYKEFNPSSPKQLLIIFKDILKRKEIKQGNRYTTDEGALSQMKGVRLAELILELRGAEKSKSTYLEPLVPGHEKSVIYADGKVHTSFLSTSTETKRTSSTKPNMQNQSKRKRKFLRKVFIPPPGKKIVSFDYGQIEARVIAMMSKDKVLVEALWNDYDIHMEWAEKVVAISPAKLKKEGSMAKVRTAIKNELVFPGFYGAFMPSIAKNLDLTENKFKPLFDEFWEMFSGVEAWQRALIKFYKEYGYIEGLTGFRRRAPLSKNMIINSPVQGTASDIVVDAMNRLSRISLKENKPELLAVINIHDDLTFFVPEKHLDESIERIVLEMLDVPYDFVNVPISVETSLGNNWADMEKIGTFKSNEI